MTPSLVLKPTALARTLNHTELKLLLFNCFSRLFIWTASAMLHIVFSLYARRSKATSVVKTFSTSPPSSRDSSVGIATRDGMDGPGFESRWGGGRDFLHPSIPTLWPTQPPIQWIPGLSSGVKRPAGGFDHPPRSSAEVEGRVVPSWSVLGWTLPLPSMPRLAPKSTYFPVPLGAGCSLLWAKARGALI